MPVCILQMRCEKMNIHSSMAYATWIELFNGVALSQASGVCEMFRLHCFIHNLASFCFFFLSSHCFDVSRCAHSVDNSNNNAKNHMPEAIQSLMIISFIEAPFWIIKTLLVFSPVLRVHRNQHGTRSTFIFLDVCFNHDFVKVAISMCGKDVWEECDDSLKVTNIQSKALVIE